MIFSQSARATMAGSARVCDHPRNSSLAQIPLSDGPALSKCVCSARHKPPRPRTGCIASKITPECFCCLERGENTTRSNKRPNLLLERQKSPHPWRLRLAPSGQ